MMNNNTLMIAAAGSGKTTLLVNKACAIKSEPVLITTYTESNEQEIRGKIIKKKGYVPSNITIQTWFSFLLQHGVRPYQSVLDEGIHEKDIGFYMLSTKSGKKLDQEGNPVQVEVKGRMQTVYWGERDFTKYYFTNSLKIYSDKTSKFVIATDTAIQNEIVSRITRIFQHVFIDEIQDLAGFDLELVKLLFKSGSAVLLVGDPRQVTYLTHHATKYGKYAEGKIKEFVENELGKRIKCEVDEKTLKSSHRNNKPICDYSAKLYPDLPVPVPCECQGCRSDPSDHEGVFLIKPAQVDQYLEDYKPVQLRWDAKKKCNGNYPVRNMGESKGATMERVLIYPTKPMISWIRDNKVDLKNPSRAKFYVAITRARRSSAIVMDYQDDEEFDGLVNYRN